MVKRDPYDRRGAWERWKRANQNGIDGISPRNSELILACLLDLEVGKNVAALSRKGPRGPARLLKLKSNLLFFARHFEALDQVSKDQAHNFFFDVSEGRVLRSDGRRFLAVGDLVKDFKAFWHWLVRTERVAADITADLRRSDGRKPPWVYLSEAEMKRLANAATVDYRALIWFAFDAGLRVTEFYSVQVRDLADDCTKLHIRDENAKTFGRTITLKLSSTLIKDLIARHDLGGEDFILIKDPDTMNKYLRSLSRRLFGSGVTPARKPYDKLRLYDLRHNSACYWLQRYPTNAGLMYRMGWSEEKMVRYYTEFLGQADEIADEHMVTAEEKNRYEQRIANLEAERARQDEQMLQIARKVHLLASQAGIPLDDPAMRIVENAVLARDAANTEPAEDVTESIPRETS